MKHSPIINYECVAAVPEYYFFGFGGNQIFCNGFADGCACFGPRHNEQAVPSKECGTILMVSKQAQQWPVALHRAARANERTSQIGVSDRSNQILAVNKACRYLLYEVVPKN